MPSSYTNAHTPSREPAWHAVHLHLGRRASLWSWKERMARYMYLKLVSLTPDQPESSLNVGANIPFLVTILRCTESLESLQ
jgi:hypothetical protein